MRFLKQYFLLLLTICSTSLPAYSLPVRFEKETIKLLKKEIVTRADKVMDAMTMVCLKRNKHIDKTQKTDL